jgi:hypothetical protein
MSDSDQNIDMQLELLSVHIPKTGGRSFGEVLKREYGDATDLRQRRSDFFPDGRFGELKLDVFPSHIRCIHSHLSVRQLMPLIDKYSPKVITWLRDPVERIISNYYFFMQRIREGNANEKQMRKRDYTFMEYATEGRKSNRMSEILEGLELKDFFFIGILENFDADLKELSAKMGWSYSGVPIHKNSNYDFKMNNDCATQYKDIDKFMRFDLEQLNHRDVELYNEVKAMRGIK